MNIQNKSIKFPRAVEVSPVTFDEPITSCWEAACYRNILLKQELKSLLFQSQFSENLIMTHIPGDRIVQEKVLNSLFGKVALVSQEKLNEYKLEKGRINPFTAHIYLGNNIRHLICPLVFENEFIYTNDDTLYGTIKFRPKELSNFLDRVQVCTELSSI
ncbi:MAG: YbaK/EbsC family protein [Crocosphaera sp.]